MKYLTGAEIRKMFLDYFKSKNHAIHPSQSLIPNDDPTLLWINSGVATLKKYFDGRKVPDNCKIANSQKAIRTNDIENVGVTARHHTFFEMLGNFSIGDYFKKEAISYAWDFLTNENYIGFDKDKLYVTIYPNDYDAYNFWVEVGMDPTHIVKIKDNFWEIGEGPSGPQTEIFYDRGEKYEYDTLKEELYPGGENERYLEIWNIVFSQFNAIDGISRDKYPELPNKNIDTGMGLERLTSIVQGVKTNYDTDLFMPIIKKIEEISKEKYLLDEEKTIAFRVISDHIRTCTFAISDGALPSNEGRGYIIRRLIRRSVKYGKQLGINRPFLKDLVPVVAKVMNDYYPEISSRIDFIEMILEKEEIRFHETLQDGLKILNNVINDATNQVIDGKTAFKLYDTYGFPIELTKEYANEANFSVDIAGFNKELDNQRQRAREAREEVNSMQSQNKTLMDIKETSTFNGYDQLKTTGKVLFIINEDKLLNVASNGDEVQIITDKTPFYAISGGQVADTGYIYNDNVKIEVIDVIKAPNKQHLHICKVVNGKINVGDKVNLDVNKELRNLTMRNHTATHLLQKALKDVLGSHIQQAGSYVDSERLRFDFNHFEAVTKNELDKIEKIVNEKIFESLNVSIKEMLIEQAKKNGATALFNEKYGETVRVVSASDFSIELCGGTHVNNTAEIGLFKIVSEGGIGAGIRRIEATTSKNALNHLQNFVCCVDNISSIVKCNLNDVVNKVNNLVDENKTLSKEIESLNAQLTNIKANKLLDGVKNINGYNYITTKVANIDINSMRNMIDNFKDKLSSVVVVIANVDSDKVTFMCGITNDYINKGLHAGKLIKEVSAICGGKGGGRGDMAQAGAKDTNNVTKALDFVQQYLKNN